MTRKEARVYYEYYAELVIQFMEAKKQLISGGVKSYTIGDRTLTRFDVNVLTKELDDAIKKKDEYAAIMNGRRPRKAVGIIPRDI